MPAVIDARSRAYRLALHHDALNPVSRTLFERHFTDTTSTVKQRLSANLNALIGHIIYQGYPSIHAVTALQSDLLAVVTTYQAVTGDEHICQIALVQLSAALGALSFDIQHL